MGMFSKWFGGKSDALPSRVASLVAPTQGKPTYVDARPGEVAVDFHAHDNVEGVPGQFITAVTEGLRASRQRELVLTMRFAPDEDVVGRMKETVRFCSVVQAWAREGNLVDEGGFTQFGERGLFGRPHGGLLYCAARALDGVRLPERALAAVFVDAKEIRTALDAGPYRVLTRIGRDLRVFPFPTWGDLQRPSAVTDRESESQLSKVTRLRAFGLGFVLEDRCLRVSIPSESTELLKGLSALPAATPFALLTRPAENANAILVWSPGQEGISGITPDGSDGSLRSGSCLMIVPSGRLSQIRPFEDGYSLTFSNEDWARVGAALSAQRSIGLDMAEGMRLELEWQPRAEGLPPANGGFR